MQTKDSKSAELVGRRTVFIIGVIPAVLLFVVRLVMPESVRYLVSRGRVAEAERTVADIEIKASEGKPLPPLAAVPAGVEERGVTVLELLIPERRKRTILLWIVSFCFLWSSNGIIFMLPQILVQRGFELRQIFGFLFVQAVAAFVGYTACAFLIDRYGRRPVLFLYYFVGAFFHLWFAHACGSTSLLRRSAGSIRACTARTGFTSASFIRPTCARRPSDGSSALAAWVRS